MSPITPSPLNETSLVPPTAFLGLLAYYPFTGNANDASGNNNNPVFNNATLTSDRFGNAGRAYSFNGIDNYMRIPNSPSLNPANQISICVWVKVAGFYQDKCHGESSKNWTLQFTIAGVNKYFTQKILLTVGTECTKVFNKIPACMFI